MVDDGVGTIREEGGEIERGESADGLDVEERRLFFCDGPLETTAS
jgi:hypothetical protein